MRPGAEIVNQADTPLKNFVPEIIAGDADKAFDGGAGKDRRAFHHCPPQHQNPIELIATVAEWKDGKLIIHEGTQNAEAVRHGLAAALGLHAGPGGGHIALCRRRLRPEELAADADRAGGCRRAAPGPPGEAGGAARPDFPRLQASVQPADIAFGSAPTAPAKWWLRSTRWMRRPRGMICFLANMRRCQSRLHGIANFRGRERLVRTDVQTPGYMRAPFEHAACFAMECCVDELAYRSVRIPSLCDWPTTRQIDPITKLPFSSRHVGECLRRGAELFGWSKRTHGAAIDARATMASFIGWGVAIGAYPGIIVPAIARLGSPSTAGYPSASVGTRWGKGFAPRSPPLSAASSACPAASVVAVIGDTRAAPQHHDRRLLGDGLGHSGRQLMPRMQC